MSQSEIPEDRQKFFGDMLSKNPLLKIIPGHYMFGSILDLEFQYSTGPHASLENSNLARTMQKISH
jgi:hypothetical protein